MDGRARQPRRDGHRDEIHNLLPGRRKIERVGIRANFQGNHSKSLKLSLEASLKKLQTDYVDLLYIHWWDYTTSIPEVMHALHHVVAAGKVLYLGISDTPAWIVSKANQLRQRSWPDAVFGVPRAVERGREGFREGHSPNV